MLVGEERMMEPLGDRSLTGNVLQALCMKAETGCSWSGGEHLRCRSA
jgi:hypothetical protein